MMDAENNYVYQQIICIEKEIISPVQLQLKPQWALQ
jgi:hypothetical protein